LSCGEADVATEADGDVVMNGSVGGSATSVQEEEEEEEEEQEEQEEQEEEQEQEELYRCVLCAGSVVNEEEEEEDTWHHNKGSLGQVGALTHIRKDFKYPLPACRTTNHHHEEKEERHKQEEKEEEDSVESFSASRTTSSLRLCGHYLHQQCYLQYRRDLAPVHYGAYVEKGIEFSCPLCKSASNVLLPLHSMHTTENKKEFPSSSSSSSSSFVSAETCSKKFQPTSIHQSTTIQQHLARIKHQLFTAKLPLFIQQQATLERLFASDTSSETASETQDFNPSRKRPLLPIKYSVVNVSHSLSSKQAEGR
jgi:hypothetical protein